MKTINKLLAKSSYADTEYTFVSDFTDIIKNKLDNYGENKEGLKSFLEDLQHGGCISGMIGDFVYHHDCKQFYVKHIDSLEEFKEELEESFGEPIQNRHNTKHYTFIVWLCFEEYCNNLYNNIFEQ